MLVYSTNYSSEELLSHENNKLSVYWNEETLYKVRHIDVKNSNAGPNNHLTWVLYFIRKKKWWAGAGRNCLKSPFNYQPCFNTWGEYTPIRKIRPL